MRRRTWLVVALAALLTAGCAPFSSTLRPAGYDIDLALDPPAHGVEATVVIDLEPLDAGPAARRERVELLLHPDLDVIDVQAEGARLRSHSLRRGASRDGAVERAARQRLVFDAPTDRLRVTLRYRGRLYQDVAAGEKEGEIHNLSVSAHVSPEGIYLEPSGYWYPRLEAPDDAPPETSLADFALAVRPPDGVELVAGAERGDDRDDGARRWSSPFPLEGLVLLGGPLERHGRSHGDVRLEAVLAPGKAAVAQDILDASAEYLDRYEPLIGPYPFDEFTVLEAFFSSGFAFPTCTQIVGSQLSEYKQYRRHGYLDHELLHNWYGNGILVDPRDGNWCEGLASYLGNYYGFVLDGDPEGARTQRRNQSNFLSSIEPEDDKPLGTFGLEDGAGRGIGYQKGASVFHMLERTIGSEALFAGLRRLNDERMGRHASWDDLRDAFERESGTDLGPFFAQWVRGSGAPLLELTDAWREPGGDTLAVTIAQGDTDFVLDVPLRLHYGDAHEDVVVLVDEPTDTVTVDCRCDELTAVELDPDYHLFRRLKPEEVMPTSSLTSRADELLVVVPDGELAEGYRVVLDARRRAAEGGDEGEARSIVVRQASELDADELRESSVLVLGEAGRHPAVAALLERAHSPLRWLEGGFGVDGADYEAPGQAVFMTVHHPDVPSGGVTVYYGNSPGALSNARVLGFYANSLLVFDTPAGVDGVEAGDAMPRAEVVRRMDFEFHERIDF